MSISFSIKCGAALLVLMVRPALAADVQAGSAAAPADDGGVLAAAPLPALADKLALYGQFVGDWDVRITNYPPHGAPTVRQGEWNFRWALEGRAIQDAFIVPARGARGKHGGGAKESYGTTLRYYDPQQDAWHITYIDPVYAAQWQMIAHRRGDEIVQDGRNQDGTPMRWIFFDIRPQSFRWRAEVQDGPGKTWRKEQEFFATRKVPHE